MGRSQRSEDRDRIECDRSAHARAWPVEAHALHRKAPGFVDGAGTAGVFQSRARAPRHDVKPLDLGDPGGERLEPDHPGGIAAVAGQQEAPAGRHVRVRETGQFAGKILIAEVKRQGCRISLEQGTDDRDLA